MAVDFENIVFVIISGAAENRSEQYKSVEKIVRSLSTEDYEVDEKEKSTLLTLSLIHI